MEALNGRPDAELFYGLYEGVFKPHMVAVAIQLGVFTPLSKGALDAHELARTTRLPVEAVRRLADYLVATGLLRRSGPHYSLTVTAKTFLLPTSQAYAGDVILGYTSNRFWDSVITSLRTGIPNPLQERFDQDAWVESYRDSRVPSSLHMWRTAGIPQPGSSQVEVLDLASGCGIKSLALAQANSRVRVTCVDKQEVLEAAADLANRMGLTDRVTLTPGDLSSVQLGENLYEACMAGQITHYMTEHQNRDLFRRVNSALVADGKLVLDVPISDEEINEPAAFLSLVLWANSEGTAHAFDTYAQLLRASGFRHVVRTGGRWIVAAK